MTQGILIINRRNPGLRYFVKASDWVNDCLYVIDAQIPYLGDTIPIVKDAFIAGGTIDESGDGNIFGGRKYDTKRV